MAEINTIDTIQTIPVVNTNNNAPQAANDNPPTVNAGPCGQCGVDPNEYDKRIRLLQERIESLEIKNITLSSECDRLHAELRESRLRERSRLVYIEALPAILLRYVMQRISTIFSYSSERNTARDIRICHSAGRRSRLSALQTRHVRQAIPRLGGFISHSSSNSPCLP